MEVERGKKLRGRRNADNKAPRRNTHRMHNAARVQPWAALGNPSGGFLLLQIQNHTGPDNKAQAPSQVRRAGATQYLIQGKNGK